MPYEEILKLIRQADDIEINLIIDALTQRYKEVYPDWEVAFLALPCNDPTERRRIMEFALKYERDSLI